VLKCAALSWSAARSCIFFCSGGRRHDVNVEMVIAIMNRYLVVDVMRRPRTAS